MINIYKNLLFMKYKKGIKKNKYIEHNAGDISTFRYPNLIDIKDNFIFEKEKELFLLNKDLNKTINFISINDITLYELLCEKAKKLHLYDFLGYKSTFKEKYNAYKEVNKNYKKNIENNSWKYALNIKEINISDIEIKPDFLAIKKYIKKSDNQNIFLCQFEDAPFIFQIGSTLKGLNITFTDGYESNYGQEIFHMIFHIEEGISGFKGDNLNIIEKWSTVPWLYLMQLLEGRLYRRTRLKSSPHDIKFLDYVFLRAYIGQAFVKETSCFHSIFALIEPTIKLMIESLNVKNAYELNEVLINAICGDETLKIKNDFNNKYGDDSFNKIFYDYNLFNRLKTLSQINNEPIINLYKKMFNKSNLVKTIIDYKLVALIWLSSVINQDKEIIIDLIEEYSNERIKQQKSIFIEDWLSHLKERFGNKKYKMVIDEYNKKLNILEEL